MRVLAAQSGQGKQLASVEQLPVEYLPAQLAYLHIHCGGLRRCLGRENLALLAGLIHGPNVCWRLTESISSISLVLGLA